MRLHLHVLTFVCAGSGVACYAGSRAAPDVNAAWRGHGRAAVEARLGAPRAAVPHPGGNQLLTWTDRETEIEAFPGGDVALDVSASSFDFRAELHAGEVRELEYVVATAMVDARGVVTSFESSWVSAGIPEDANLRTGAVYGLSVGMARLDDAGTALPGCAAYIGGMIDARLALLGTYTFVNGIGDEEYVHGHSWAFAAQYWPDARLNLRAGPAMVLDTDPHDDPQLAFGAVAAASYALIRSGMFVLDLRLDATLSTANAFGMVGIGVNVN